MSFIDAIILGLVQGITEFLPVSSSGHLVFARELFDIEVNAPLALDGVLHLATVVAVITYFAGDIWALVQTGLRKLGRLPVNPREEILLSALIIGTIPAVVCGLLFEAYIVQYGMSPIVTATTLFLAACFFMYAEWRYSLEHRTSDLSVRTGFKIGLFQALALLPGFSRSGATIAGGMLLGLTREDASKFSFLLAIPVTLGVGIQKLLQFLTSEEAVDWVALFVAAGVASVTAFLVIHAFLGYIRRFSLWPFIWYTLILSVFVLTLFWFS
jgi:undecaprenyl-diphosphatase